MKKYLFFFALAALAFASCKKTDVEGDGGPARDLEATLTITNDLSNVVFAEPVDIAGTAESSEAIDGCTLVSVKKSGDTYTEVGESQTGNVDGKNITAQFFVDSKEITDIKVTLTAGNAARSFYFPVGEVTGELKGHVYYNETASLVANSKILNHENTPDTYPEENTGAGSDVKSFFAMHGVVVNGTMEHLVSYNDLIPVDGKNMSMSFINVFENTKENKVLGTQRGYTFYYCKNFTSGTIGRHCDVYPMGNHFLNKDNADNFEWELVKGSWAGESYDEARYKAIDKLFMSISEPKTPLEEMKAFWQLGEIQRIYDNATLGEENNPTNLDLGYLLRVWSDAGPTATKQPNENLRAGDYFICRSTRGTVDDPIYYYGLIQVLRLPETVLNDTNASGYNCISEETAQEMFMKPVYLNIKCQFEVPAE